MVTRPLRVLIVEDLPTDTKLIVRLLEQNGFVPSFLRVDTRDATQTALNSREWDIVIADYRLPAFSALDVLAMLTESGKDIPCLVVTGSVGEETAVETMRAGAADIILKTSLTRLVPAIERELREAASRRERRQAEQTLRENEERFRLVTRATNDAVWDWNLQTDHIWWSENIQTLFGYSSEAVVSHFSWWQENIHPDDRERVVASLRAATQCGPQIWSAEYRFRRSDGGYADVLDRGYVLTPPQGSAAGRMIGAMMDITERRRNEETIRWQAHHDALTGLPNRALFQDRLAQALREAQRHGHTLAVAFLDLDGFKHINDTLGHQAGDALLKEVARRLAICLRAEDTIARQGGDEFTLLLPFMDSANGPEAVTPVAKRLLKCFDTPFSINGHELFVTTSMGICFTSPGAQDVETLLRHADMAMYQAKAHGRGCYRFYEEEAAPERRARLQLECGLRNAMQNGELNLYYQPKLHLRSGQIIGVESLARWQHPERGLLLPSQFMPVAEEAGLVEAMGEWALREAAQQAEIWQEAGRYLPISVNFAARHFNQKGMSESVESVLADCAAESGWLGIELTESAFLHNREAAIETMQALSRSQVHLALDDFGTGASSLAYLRDFPIDVVKIDPLFVADLANDARDQAVVKAIVGLCHALGKTVLAEGVETEAQRAILHELDCDAIQGNLVCPPLPPHSLLMFLDGIAPLSLVS